MYRRKEKRLAWLMAILFVLDQFVFLAENIFLAIKKIKLFVWMHIGLVFLLWFSLLAVFFRLIWLMRKLHHYEYNQHKKHLAAYTAMLSLVFALFVFREVDNIKVGSKLNFEDLKHDVHFSLRDIQYACQHHQYLYVSSQITFVFADILMLQFTYVALVVIYVKKSQDIL